MTSLLLIIEGRDGIGHVIKTEIGTEEMGIEPEGGGADLHGIVKGGGVDHVIVTGGGVGHMIMTGEGKGAGHEIGGAGGTVFFY